MSGYLVSQFLTPFINRPTTSTDKSIGQVLESTKSSHQPVYVLDDEKFVGVVSAYQSIYHNAHAPHTKKVSSEFIKTPHLTPTSPIYDAIRAMMDSRLYELPVFANKNKKKIEGVIKIQTLLKGLSKDPVVFEFLSQCIQPKTPITRIHDGTVKDVFHLLRENNISRIILTDKNGKLDGIVSRGDIQIAFLRPNDRQRFRGMAEGKSQMFFDEEETYREDDPIERFSQKNVFSLDDKTPKKEILKQLLASQYNSVVLIDSLQRPTGFLSLRDIIYCLATLNSEPDTAILFEKPEKLVAETTIHNAENKITDMVQKLSKIRPIEKVEVTLNTQKFSNQKVASFEIGLHMNIPGCNVAVTASDKDYLKGLTTAIHHAERQFMKITKRSYHKTHSSPL